MKAWIWLRGLAGILVFFTVSHTIGFMAPPHGGPQAAVFDAMTRVHFPVMGFDRSYGDFYRGFGLFVSVEFLLLAVMAMQASRVGRRDPRQALPMVYTLEAGCVATAVLSCVYFFAAPIVVSFVAVVCSTVALVGLARDARVQARA